MLNVGRMKQIKGYGKMDNKHKDCEYYVEQNDMCLEYYALGYHNVSRYPQCLKEVIWSE
jgi:hypothetical protein